MSSNSKLITIHDLSAARKEITRIINLKHILDVSFKLNLKDHHGSAYSNLALLHWINHWWSWSLSTSESFQCIPWALQRHLWEYLSTCFLWYCPPVNQVPQKVHSAPDIVVNTPLDCPQIIPKAFYSVLAIVLRIHHHPHCQLSVLNTSVVTATSLEAQLETRFTKLLDLPLWDSPTQ